MEITAKREVRKSVVELLTEAGLDDLASEISIGKNILQRIRNNSIPQAELIATIQDLSESQTLYESSTYEACFQLWRLRNSGALQIPKEPLEK
ncbi:hypothetical protein A2125_02485 [Candidatus Woesebacteria bacterium GWB1_43_5]|uniref:Uncharacterized protein n=1 Tax=Candidatus Woesebacteria bacterium GWB1_43_5 TaxID=1802474 RepID=A0A1F7WV84_9BACT|nr:MAG: hypothetical protein A2125_02485 [Candidatus Woesebacteria bacterium GWB1_43_5]